MIIEQPFEQCGFNIIGEIVPNSSKQHRYILTATDYFTKWVEAIPLKSITTDQVISFLDQFIITRFGLSCTLVFDNATYFSSLSLMEYALQKGIKIKHSANYYPQGNGLEKSTIKNILNFFEENYR
jgi:hypothetical protein